MNIYFKIYHIFHLYFLKLRAILREKTKKTYKKVKNKCIVNHFYE